MVCKIINSNISYLYQKYIGTKERKLVETVFQLNDAVQVRKQFSNLPLIVSFFRPEHFVQTITDVFAACVE